MRAEMEKVFSQPRDGAQGKPSFAPFHGQMDQDRGRRSVTPRQACPRPNGFGRNLRSKTRWFTGFCNSHQVSHFATFFIDARAEISVAESHFAHYCIRHCRIRHRFRAGRTCCTFENSLVHSAPGICSAARTCQLTLGG